MITALDKQSALVLIDLQNGIVGMPSVHPIQGVIANAVALVQAFRARALPVVIVNVDPSVRGPVSKARVQASMSALKPAPGAPNPYLDPSFAEIVPEIELRPEDIRITKKTWGAFSYTDLHEQLQKRGVTGIVLGGVATSFGVESTARFASELGYNLSFATDAMTDRAQSAHDNSIQLIFPRIGELGTTQEIIAQLQA